MDRSGSDVFKDFEALVGRLAELPDATIIDLTARIEGSLSSLRLGAVARSAGSCGDVRADRRRARRVLGPVLASGGCSSSSINRDARRAAALAANPKLAERVAAGGISSDAIDAVAQAADADTGAIDDDLVDAVVGLSADETRRFVDQYRDDHTSRDDANDEHERATEARRARRYELPAKGGEPGLVGIGIEGPAAIINRLWDQLEAEADAAYRAAGGRDRSIDDHVSFQHRLFDAAVRRLNGDRPDSSSTGGSQDSGGGGTRSTVVITVDWEDVVTDDSRAGAAVQVGTGPIGDEALEACLGGELGVLIRGLDGQPMWYGRARRHSSIHQFLALTIRDRGCVLCGKAPNRCQAHHLMPWTAPGKGRTDIDQMALLCGRCHRDLHDRNHTLFHQLRKGRRIWLTRPSNTDETPSARPPEPTSTATSRTASLASTGPVERSEEES